MSPGGPPVGGCIEKITSPQQRRKGTLFQKNRQDFHAILFGPFKEHRLPAFPLPPRGARRRRQQEHHEIGAETRFRFRNQILLLVNETVIDKAGQIAAELQEFAQLDGKIPVARRMRQKCRLQAVSITRNPSDSESSEPAQCIG